MSDQILDGMKWKSLEFEEQAHVRKLIRQGKARIEGSGPDRLVRLLPAGTTFLKPSPEKD